MSGRKLLFPVFLLALYALATLPFIRYYVVATTFYLDIPRYLAGHERLPFQERILPIVLMQPINHSAFLMRHFTHPSGPWDGASASTPQTFAFYVLALVSFSIAGYLTVRLYRAVNPTGALAALVYPLFMVLTLWTYVVHIDADFSYPYDMPSLAFFTGGLLAIYKRRFLPLLAILFFGTFNRETTLFLIASTSSTPPLGTFPAASPIRSTGSTTQSGCATGSRSRRFPGSASSPFLSSGSS
jgi:hypothetical protein